MKLGYLLACSVFCASASLHAANPVDLGELKPEVIYNYDAMVPVMGYYVPAESGIIRCYSSGSQISPYMEETHDTPIDASQSFYGASGEKVRIYNVNAGETLYFYNSFPLDGGTFRISVDQEPVQLVDVSPKADGSKLSLSSNYSATLSFNIPINCTKCTVAVNGEKAEITPNVVNSYITINWFNTLRQWYRDGKIKEGDTMTLTVTGIRDVTDAVNRPDFGDGPGKLVLNYVMAARPAELLWEKGTPSAGVTDFLTYYLPGSDEGIVSLMFSEELDPNCRPLTELTYGDIDNLELGMYIERPPVSVEGNTVTVNLQGVTRFPEQMIPGLPAQSTIDLKITGIKSADGQYVLTGYSASPYSFGFGYNLKSVVYSLGADWMPLPGSPLLSGDDMEIWVLNGSKIVFDSVDFSYIKDGAPVKVSVPYSELTVTKDSADDMLYNLTAPTMTPDPETEIIVTFGGLKCADGLDHDSDILAKYKSASTGVDGIMADDSCKVYYDLTGRRVANPSRGIYVLNGKKVLVK